MTIKQYLQNPLIFEFTASVVDRTDHDNGTSDIILDETYFYPTGGGQAHDRGAIDTYPVVDVRKEGETVIHTIEGHLTAAQVNCVIDADYRQRNMGVHTGQHILSAAFLQELNAETLAVKMSADGLSTVDVSVPDLTDDQIDRVETLANRIIMENREVHSYFVPSDSPKLDDLRRAVKFDKVSGDVRLVEIADFDLSACAGTHFPYTGMLGLLKILKVENYKGGSRVYFVAGLAVIEQFRHYHRMLDAVSNLLSTGTAQVYELVEKLQTERSELSKQLATQLERLLDLEAREILRDDDRAVLTLTFDDRPADDMRTLANHLTASRDLVVITNRMAEDMMLIVASSSSSGHHAGNLLRSIVTALGGRGGGRETYAQGVLKDFSDLPAVQQVLADHLP